MKNKIINFLGMKLKNPVFIASGIAGIGEEYSRITDLNKLGGFITKTVTLQPREGNPPPRIHETPAGMINTIGLENPGIDKFIEVKIPVIRKTFKIPVIISVGGINSSEFIEVIKRLEDIDCVSAIELNLSCPNVRENGEPKKLISQDRELTYKTVKEIKASTKFPLIAKLTPAVTDITEIASVCKEAGADAVSLINTFPAMCFPVKSVQEIKRNYETGGKIGELPPFIAGGLSGPCIKPIALKMVYEVKRKVNIPVMALGGINSIDDILQFLSVGASVVALGSSLFRNPSLIDEVLGDGGTLAP